MGRLETSWAFAVLIGAPIFGLVISIFSVSTMFAGLVLVSTLSTYLVWKTFGEAHSGGPSGDESPIRLAGWKGRSGGTRSGAEMGPASKKESPIRLAGRKGRPGGTRSAAEMGPASMRESDLSENPDYSTIASAGSPQAKALRRRIIAALVCSAALSFGSICVFSVYGSWLTERFGLSVRAVGLFSVFVGIAELAASTLSSTKTDLWGKRRSVAMGSLVMLAGMAGIGIVPKITVLGVAVLVLMFLGFEFGYVSLLSVISEVGEHRKGTVLSIDHALSPLGRAGAAALATNVFDSHGIGPVSLIGGVASIVAFAAIRSATNR
jgi:Major Facilitator Superfamily